MISLVLAVFLPFSVQEPSPSPPPAAAQETPASPAPSPTPPPKPLTPQQHESLRALAAFLRTEMEHALQGAQQAPFTGRPNRMFLSTVRMFSRRAQGFQSRIDKYQETPFDAAKEVQGMHKRAQMITQRLRRMKVFEHTYEDWEAVIDVLDRMNRVVAGEKVAVPPAHTPRPVPPPPGNLAPQQVEEFKRLSLELRALAVQSLEAAQAAAARPPAAAQEKMLQDLARFAERAAAVHARAGGAALLVDFRGQIFPLVAELKMEAAAADKQIREGGVFPTLADQWTRVSELVNRMEQQLRARRPPGVIVP